MELRWSQRELSTGSIRPQASWNSIWARPRNHIANGIRSLPAGSLYANLRSGRRSCITVIILVSVPAGTFGFELASALGARSQFQKLSPSVTHGVGQRAMAFGTSKYIF